MRIWDCARALTTLLQSVVCARTYLPQWAPLVFSSKFAKSESSTDLSEVEIMEHLGELYNLPRAQNLHIFIGMGPPEAKVPSLLDHEAARFPWVADMRSDDTGRECMAVCRFKLVNASVRLAQQLRRELGEDPLLAVSFTEQVVSPSCTLSHGWLCCPPHPHVLPLMSFVGQNISIHPPVKGVSGTLFAMSVTGSGLKPFQKNLIFLTVGENPGITPKSPGVTLALFVSIFEGSRGGFGYMVPCVVFLSVRPANVCWTDLCVRPFAQACTWRGAWSTCISTGSGTSTSSPTTW